MNSLARELVLQVVVFLDTTSKVCLESTCKRLRTIVRTTWPDNTDITALLGSQGSPEAFVTWLAANRGRKIQRIQLLWIGWDDFNSLTRKLLLEVWRLHETLEEIDLQSVYGMARNEQVLEALFSMCTKLRSFRYIGSSRSMQGIFGATTW